MGKTKRKLNNQIGFFNRRKKPFCDWPRHQAVSSNPLRVAAQNVAGEQSGLIGSISLSFIILFFVVIAGGMYLYSINSSAVKGYEMRQAEKDVASLKKENEKLIIKEAELKSLYNIEEASKKLNMEKLEDIRYVNETSPVALK